MSIYNKIIKHSRNMDICYYVNKCFDTGKKYKVKVTVINMMQKRSIPLNIDLKFEILKSEIHNWHYCKEPDAKSLRYVEWARFK